MKKFKKWVAYIVITTILVIVVGVCYITLALPNVGKAQEIKVKLTPQRIERGKYLANHVAVCIDCHSTRDWNKFAGPIVPNGVGAGERSLMDVLVSPEKYMCPILPRQI
jgi:hypothetical protein